MSDTQTLRRGMRPEDIGALRHVHDTRVSPDGASVAFTVTDVDLEANRYRSRVWLASTDGQLPPRPFSAGPTTNYRCGLPTGSGWHLRLRRLKAPVRLPYSPLRTAGRGSSWPPGRRP